ncbi:MAG: hypothetical protein KF899_10605 [Parvibaculum sp.]|nr:hypothetical protein [Parvibaculum sp.]
MTKVRMNAWRSGVLLIFATAFFFSYLAKADDVMFSLLDEEIYDVQIKTQIAQNIVVLGLPSEAEIRTELTDRYRAAMARRGFEYHNPATNIYIYIYGSEEQARAGQGLWVGMLAKSALNNGEPQITISESRLAALSNAPEDRFGLSEDQRKRVFRETVASENRATKEAMARVPNSELMKQIQLEGELMEKYKGEVARKYGLSEEQMLQISVEGIKSGWPMR